MQNHSIVKRTIYKIVETICGRRNPISNPEKPLVRHSQSNLVKQCWILLVANSSQVNGFVCDDVSEFVDAIKSVDAHKEYTDRAYNDVVICFADFIDNTTFIVVLHIKYSFGISILFIQPTSFIENVLKTMNRPEANGFKNERIAAMNNIYSKHYNREMKLEDIYAEKNIFLIHFCPEFG